MAGRRKNTRRNTAEAHWEKYHAAKAAKGLTGAVSPADHPDVIVHAYRARRASKAAKGQDTSSLDAAIKKANADNAPPGGWGEGDVLTRARTTSNRRKNTRQNASRLQSLGALHDLRAQYGDGTKAYYQAVKQALLNKEISPGSLVGSGYKSPRRAALKYLDNKIQGATSNRRRNTRKANHHLKVGDRAEYTPIPGVFGAITKAHAGDKYDIQWEQTGATQTNITGSKLKKAGKKNRRNTRRKNQRHGLFVI